MKAAVLHSPGPITSRPLRIEDAPQPEPQPGQVLLRVRVCGVCRTDLHIVEGELAPLHETIIPGHQIVGEVLQDTTATHQPGTRVGVSWIGGVDGTCPYCRRGLENLCDSPTFTGYSSNGGYAECAIARADFVFPLPAALDDLHAAPLLCAGIIGFRSLRVAGVEKGERVGLFWLRRVRAPRDSRSPRLELRSLRIHSRRIAPETCSLAWCSLGGDGDGSAAPPT